MNEFFEKEHIPMDVDKFITRDPILEQTSIKAWIVEICISFTTLKDLLTLYIDIQALSI
jgi:hypothetical protein